MTASSTMLTIVSNRQSSFTIHVASNNHVARFAAEELRRYIDRMAGVSLPIVTDSQDSRRICLTMLPADSQGCDRYRIRVGEDAVEIVGYGEFALLHAAYVFLEMAGCRWFAPDYRFYGTAGGSVVPSVASIDVPRVDIDASAGFENRKRFVECAQSHDVDSLLQLIDWMPKVGSNVIDFPVDCFHRGTAVWDHWRERLIPQLQVRGIRIEVGGHGYENFITAETLAQHPRWAGMRPDGSREPDPLKRVFCTSNAAATAQLLELVERYLSTHPEITTFSFWPPDTRDWCECEACRALGPIEYRHALLVNAAARSAAQLRRNLTISMAAYFEPSKPPAGIELERNVEVDFCPIVRSYERSIFDPSDSVNRQYHDLLLEWTESPALQGDLNVYIYYPKYAWRSLPMLLLTLVTDELRHYRSLGIAGIGSYCEAGDWWTFELLHYLMAKLSFAPQMSVDALLTDYYQHRYAEAAQPIADLVRLIENFLPHVARVPGSSISAQSQPDSIYEFFKPSQKLMQGYESCVSQCYALLRRAEVSCGSNAQVLERLMKWRTLIDYVALEVEARGLALAMADRALGGYLKDYVAAMTRMTALAKANRDNGLILYEEWAEYERELPVAAQSRGDVRTDHDLRASLGIQAIINAGGYQTVNGASQVPAEIIDAAAAVLPCSVQMEALQTLASQAIAEVTGAEAGFVTACAAAGISIAVAAAMTGDDADAVRRLPDTSKLKHTVALAAAHDIDFGGQIGQMIRLAGARLALAGSAAGCSEEQLREILDERIAAAVYVVSDHIRPGRVVSLERFIEVAHARGVPVIVDCAAEYDMRAFVASGADAVIYSAHKVLNGLTAGILAGRRDFIDACRRQGVGIGRTMKVGKEGVVAAIAALHRWKALDHASIERQWRDRTRQAFALLHDHGALVVSIVEDANGNPVPRTRLEVTRDRCGLSANELRQRLAALSPPIFLRVPDDEPDALLIDPRSLTTEEVRIVCDSIVRQIEAANKKEAVRSF